MKCFEVIAFFAVCFVSLKALGAAPAAPPPPAPPPPPPPPGPGPATNSKMVAPGSSDEMIRRPGPLPSQPCGPTAIDSKSKECYNNWGSYSSTQDTKSQGYTLNTADSCETKKSEDSCGNKNESSQQTSSIDQNAHYDESKSKSNDQYNYLTCIDRETKERQDPCGTSVSKTDENVKSAYQNSGCQETVGKSTNLDRSASTYDNQQKIENCNGDKVTATQSGQKESTNIADTNYDYKSLHGSMGESDSSTTTKRIAPACGPTVTDITGTSNGWDQGCYEGTNKVTNNNFNKGSTHDQTSQTTENCKGDKSTTTGQTNTGTIGQNSDQYVNKYGSQYGGAYENCYDRKIVEPNCAPCPPCPPSPPCLM